MLSSIPRIANSCLNASSDLSLNSKSIREWKCIASENRPGCDGVWKESVIKRVQFTMCPKCEPDKTRKAVVRAMVIKTPAYTHVCGICVAEVPKLVECPMCEYMACHECMKRYILDGDVEARCMNPGCEKPFSNAFLTTNFTKTWFRETYNKHMEKLWTQMELSLIPDTMPLVAMIKKRNSLMSELDATRRCPLATQEEKEERDDMLNGIRAEVHELERKMYAYPDSPDGEMNVVRYAYIQGCPNQTCNGLVNTNYKCEVCGGNVCDKCRMFIDKCHVCDPNDVETVKSFKGDVKPCPKCASPIFKVDGCDQMWCVGCRTAFSWITGTISTTVIHNPHYYEWLRQKSIENGGDGTIPRDAGRVNVCGIEWDDDDTAILRKEIGYDDAMLFTHILAMFTDRALPTINYDEKEFINTLYMMRTNYILGKVSKDKWLKDTMHQRRYMYLTKRTHEVFSTMRDVMQDRLRLFIAEFHETDVAEAYVNFIRDAHVIREYFNEAIVEENSGCQYKHIRVISKKWNPCTYDVYRRDARKG